VAPVKATEERERRLGRADEICRTIERYELELDLLLSMRRIDPELPDNFFRSDSIVPQPPPAPASGASQDPEQLAGRIGARIREEREGRGWTQQDLADRTGIRRPNIARLERGAGLPNLSTLLKVAAGLETAIEDLITSD
jgi:DNA-binding XRE family transcriptional regulator